MVFVLIAADWKSNSQRVGASMPNIKTAHERTELSASQARKFKKWTKRWEHQHALACARASTKGLEFSSSDEGYITVFALKEGVYWDMLSSPDPARMVIKKRSKYGLLADCLDCSSYRSTQGKGPVLFRSLYAIWRTHCGSVEAEAILEKLSAGATVDFLVLGGGSTAALLR